MSMNTPVTFFSPTSRAASQFDYTANMPSQAQLAAYSREHFGPDHLEQEELAQEKLTLEKLTLEKLTLEKLSQGRLTETLGKRSCSLTMSTDSPDCSIGSVMPITDRSEMAMRVAKGMSRSRHKKQDGRIVCRLLLDMLKQESTPQPIVRSSRFWLDQVEESGSDGKSKQAEKQFSLSF
jgi:hypothetical protein